MPKTYEEMIERLTAVQRKRVKARAEKLIAEEKFRRAVRRELGASRKER